MMQYCFSRALVALAFACAVTNTCAAEFAERYFQIKVVDEKTGRGVPLVELKTAHHVCYYTDSNGLVAFLEPGLMDQRVYFFVRSHGYEFPKDGLGNAGLALDVKPGGKAEIKLKRLNIAERLYRVTGAGIYRDSVLLGAPVPLQRPNLSGQVTGQDSVLAVPYRGKLYWFWGDTNPTRYPFGNFHTSGATSELPGKGGLDPARGVDLDYFVDEKGFSRPMAPIPGNGIVWIDGTLTVPDETGRERLLTRYARLEGLGKQLEHGLALFNDDKAIFEKIVEFDMAEQWKCPRGHPLRVKRDGQEYFYFPVPFPTVRVKADFASITNAATYESYTCLPPGSGTNAAEVRINRDAAGRPLYTWTTNAPHLTQKFERELVKAGKLTADEARFQIADADTGKPVDIHGGSVYWNSYRRKWIMIASEIFGTSMLGEIWYAEADPPEGPWRRAKKIVTHDRYSFYNPTQHPFFDQEGGRVIYFEGTYTATFSGNTNHTPYYDYNQIMYRLNLADPRLAAAREP